MTELLAAPAGMSTYGASAHAMAGEIAEAGAASAAPTLLGAAFGLIGADFVAAFTAAQANHTHALTTLAHTAAALGDATFAAAANYADVDTTHASAIGDRP